MGVCVLVIGKSGSGKSTSLRNFEEGQVGILNVLGKPLPFRKSLERFDVPGYEGAKACLKKNSKRCYVVDDSTYLMQMENFRRAGENGYGKFTEMAVNFEQLLEAAMNTDRDTITYFLHHPQFADNGSAKPQTIGKMLDTQLNIEGIFPIVIECKVIDGKHVFVTENDGFNIAKAPMDMLPAVMDNDLALVDSMIREYWGLKSLDEE